jgi:prevent-host-death family protein
VAKQFNVHEAKTHFSRLLDAVIEGEEILITRNGVPVAEIVPARKRGIVLGSGRHDPNINEAALRRDSWWQSMTNEEAQDFIDGRL